MAVVEREDAIINSQIRMRVEFRYDRTGNLFDPDSIDQVQVLDSDHSTVLETVTLTNIVNPTAGKYYFDSVLSWNTVSKKTFDRWTVTVDGQTYYLEAFTNILSAVAPSVGIASFVSLVKLKVQAPTIGPVASKITDPDDYETLIKEALKQYSKRRPQKMVAKLTGDGNSYFSLPNDWEDRFSWIRNIEYPLDSDDLPRMPPYYIEEKFYEVEEIETGLICRFLDTGYPGDGELFYFRYVIRHVVDDSSSTVPLVDKDSVCDLAAGLCCQALAQAYGHTSDSTIEADVIAYRTRGDEFASRAKELYKLYNDAVKPDTTGFIGEWDIQSYWEGNRNLLLKQNTLI